MKMKISEIQEKLEQLIKDKQAYIDNTKKHYLVPGNEIIDILDNDNFFNAAVNEQILKSLNHLLEQFRNGNIRCEDNLRSRKESYEESLIDFLETVSNKDQLSISDRIKMKRLLYVYRKLEEWIRFSF